MRQGRNAGERRHVAHPFGVDVHVAPVIQAVDVLGASNPSRDRDLFNLVLMYRYIWNEDCNGVAIAEDLRERRLPRPGSLIWASANAEALGEI